MAGDVPAGILAGVRKQRAGAGDVFFRAEGVDLELDFVAVMRNREYADAMDRRRSGAELGDGGAQVEPGEVDRIGDEEKSGKGGRDTGKEANAGGGWSRICHSRWRRYCAPGRF